MPRNFPVSVLWELSFLLIIRWWCTPCFEQYFSSSNCMLRCIFPCFWVHGCEQLDEVIVQNLVLLILAPRKHLDFPVAASWATWLRLWLLGWCISRWQTLFRDIALICSIRNKVQMTAQVTDLCSSVSCGCWSFVKHWMVMRAVEVMLLWLTPGVGADWTWLVTCILLSIDIDPVNLAGFVVDSLWLLEEPRVISCRCWPYPTDCESCTAHWT